MEQNKTIISERRYDSMLKQETKKTIGLIVEKQQFLLYRLDHLEVRIELSMRSSSKPGYVHAIQSRERRVISHQGECSRMPSNGLFAASERGSRQRPEPT